MASVDYFLKIDGIDGESKDDKHKGEIDLESFSFGGTQAISSRTGGGGGAGKVSLQDFHLVMTVSKASPKLFLHCCNGAHIKSAVLVARKAGKEQQEYLKITLSDCIVSSFAGGGASAADVVPVDQVALNFAKIEMEYKEQKADGSLAGPLKTGWDLKANKAV
jgi:type VI secretion system secreted protein Hcp